jgi:hypothetical protein
MKTREKKSFILGLTFFVCFFVETSFATHNVSRYFPFLERPEEIFIKNRSQLDVLAFYVSTSTSLNRSGGTSGISELWGSYDLKDVVSSLQATQGAAADPIRWVSSDPSYLGQPIKFKVGGKIRGAGLTLGYEHDLGWKGFQLGAWIPIMSIRTTSKFSFNRGESGSFFNNSTLNGYLFQDEYKKNQELSVDKMRRLTHETIGFKGNEWNKSGIGDIDFHLRWNRRFDRVVMMRSIDMNIQAGVLIPTGVKSNIDYPASVPFGSNGHWGIYGDFATELELKEGWELGLIFGFVHQFPHTTTTRIPIGNEPAIFSSLIGRVKVSPGDTFKFSPYFTLKNVADGLNFQVRYTYLRHCIDTWSDVRDNKTIQSCFDTDIDIVRRNKNLTKRRAHYATLQLNYDLKDAMKNYVFDPVLFVGYDVPISGSGFAKTHQIWLGGRLRF